MVFMRLCTSLTVAIVVLIVASVSVAQISAIASRQIENQYLSVKILPGWKLGASQDQKLDLSKGKYVLVIDPIYTHATSFAYFGDVTQGIPSVEAVTANVDQPADHLVCSQSETISISNDIFLTNLYTDKSVRDEGCHFPSFDQSVWFGSYFDGMTSKSEYTITLGYDSKDVDSLPAKESKELAQVLREVTAMLKTLRLKPPITVTRVVPASALPGETVTIYGTGFKAASFATVVFFKDFPNNPMAPPTIAENGKSLKFRVPTSIDTIDCLKGFIAVNEGCGPIPANHVDVTDCPHKSDGSPNFCGIPISPGAYELLVELEGSGVYSDPASFTVTAPPPEQVAISLIYPNYLVSAGETITLRGSGFTASGNVVTIGAAVVENLPSPDGKTMMFQAPAPAGDSFIQGLRYYDVSVANQNGHSNLISFSYR